MSRTYGATLKNNQTSHYVRGDRIRVLFQKTFPPFQAQVFPFRVHLIYQLVLLFSTLFLYLFFPCNSSLYIWCFLKINKLLQIIFLCESFSPRIIRIFCSIISTGINAFISPPNLRCQFVTSRITSLVFRYHVDLSLLRHFNQFHDISRNAFLKLPCLNIQLLQFLIHFLKPFVEVKLFSFFLCNSNISPRIQRISMFSYLFNRSNPAKPCQILILAFREVFLNQFGTSIVCLDRFSSV